MTVAFILLNKTKPVVDAEVTIYPENGLKDAVGTLKKTVQSGAFKVNFQTSKNSFFFMLYFSQLIHVVNSYDRVKKNI